MEYRSLDVSLETLPISNCPKFRTREELRMLPPSELGLLTWPASKRKKQLRPVICVEHSQML